MKAEDVTVWRLGDRVAVELDTKFGHVHALARDGSTVDVKLTTGRVVRILATSPFLRRQP